MDRKRYLKIVVDEAVHEKLKTPRKLEGDERSIQRRFAPFCRAIALDKPVPDIMRAVAFARGCSVDELLAAACKR